MIDRNGSYSPTLSVYDADNHSVPGKLSVSNDLTITEVTNINAVAGRDHRGRRPLLKRFGRWRQRQHHDDRRRDREDLLAPILPVEEQAAFPGGGIIINLAGYLDANVTQPLAGPLVINQLGNLYGVFQVGGDVTTNDTSIGGTGVIDFAGSGVQTLYAGVNLGQLPNVEIDKTGGSLTVGTANTLSIGGNWDYDAGTFNAAGSTVKFTGGGTAHVDTGSVVVLQRRHQPLRLP